MQATSDYSSEDETYSSPGSAKTADLEEGSSDDYDNEESDAEEEGEHQGEMEIVPPESVVKTRSWYKDGNVYRLLVMLTLTALFGIVEFAVGILTNSLALVSDAFHMASDTLSLVVGLIALQMSKRTNPSKKFSYGWARAEILGGLINGVFLISVVFFICLEAIERFIEPPEIEDALLIVYIGAGGLVINLIGLLIFLRHSSMGHGHSHGGSASTHGHSHAKKKKRSFVPFRKKTDNKETATNEGDSKDEDDQDSKGKDIKIKKKQKSASHNLHGVFLHVLGDALGSIAAITSGLFIEFVPWKDRYYIDPTLSVIIALIILRSAVPLVRSCIAILMEGVPNDVSITALQRQLEEVDSVHKVHELHVWTLGPKKLASVHVLCFEEVGFMKVARRIRQIFHDFDIHSVTIQPEFLRSNEQSAETEEDQSDILDVQDEDACLLQCVKDCDTTQQSLVHRRKKRARTKSGSRAADEVEGDVESRPSSSAASSANE